MTSLIARSFERLSSYHKIRRHSSKPRRQEPSTNSPADPPGQEAVPELETELKWQPAFCLDLDEDTHDHRHAKQATLKFTEMLLRRLVSPTVSKTTVLASIELSLLLVEHYANREHGISKLIEAQASTILSILSTEVVLSEDIEDSRALQSLCRVTISPCFREKMIRRRCTILAITKHAKQTESATCQPALLALQAVLQDENCKEYLRRTSSDGNADILLESLTEAVLNTSNPNYQLIAIPALHVIVDISSHLKNSAMDIFKCLAYTGAAEQVMIDSASSFCKAMHDVEDPPDDHMWTLADFITSPFQEVRRQAFESIEGMTSYPDKIMRLFSASEFVENASIVLRRGSVFDKKSALNILRQITRSSLHHDDLLSEPEFFPSVVQAAIYGHSEDVTSRVYAVETVLSLLANPHNHGTFRRLRNFQPLMDDMMRTPCINDFSKSIMKSAFEKLVLSNKITEDQGAKL